MVYPLVALFFGTGNQTPYISCAILVSVLRNDKDVQIFTIASQERVFMDPSMKLFEFSNKSLLASIPTMLAFPKVSQPLPALVAFIHIHTQLHDCYQVVFRSFGEIHSNTQLSDVGVEDGDCFTG
jgi:hypothetical protein